MKKKEVLPAAERKPLWVDLETYELVRNFALENGYTMVAATNHLLGLVFVAMARGDFGQSPAVQDIGEGEDRA
jgi:hypothetical protein